MKKIFYINDNEFSFKDFDLELQKHNIDIDNIKTFDERSLVYKVDENVFRIVEDFGFEFYINGAEIGSRMFFDKLKGEGLYEPEDPIEKKFQDFLYHAHNKVYPVSRYSRVPRYETLNLEIGDFNITLKRTL